MLAVLTEPSRRHRLVRRDRDAAVAIGRDVDRIRAAIKLAEEAGLAILAPRQKRQPRRRAIEHVRRTDLHAFTTINTTIGQNELDHVAASSLCGDDNGARSASAAISM